MVYWSLVLIACVVNVVICGEECVRDMHGNEHCHKKTEYEEKEEVIPSLYDEESNTKAVKEPYFIWDPVKVTFYNSYIFVKPCTLRHCLEDETTRHHPVW